MFDLNKQAAVPFVVPSDGPTFIEQVRIRCEDLVRCDIWADLSIQRLNQWWSNFRTDIERYFAACLLDSVIYRSEAQTVALMRQLVQRALPDHGRATGGVSDWDVRLSEQWSVRLDEVNEPLFSHLAGNSGNG